MATQTHVDTTSADFNAGTFSNTNATDVADQVQLNGVLVPIPKAGTTVYPTTTLYPMSSTETHYATSGTWTSLTDSFDINSNLDPTTPSVISWTTGGTGTITVETNVNAAGWVAATNGGTISGLTHFMGTTTIQVRVTLSGDAYHTPTLLSITKTVNVLAPAVSRSLSGSASATGTATGAARKLLARPLSKPLAYDVVPVPYKYFKTHSIRGSVDGALTDYQVKVVVHSGSGVDGTPYPEDVYLNSHSENWPYDVEFLARDGTMLDYYREAYDASSQTIWIRIPNIPASPALYTFVMRYGNVNGQDTSTLGADVFSWFDDFIPRPTTNLLPAESSGLDYNSSGASFNNCTYGTSFTYFRKGASSISVVATASGDAEMDSYAMQGCQPSTTYSWQAWVYCPTSFYLNLPDFGLREVGGDWEYFAPATLDDTLTGFQSVSGGVWHKLSGTGVSPASLTDMMYLILRPARNSGNTDYDLAKTIYYDCLMVEQSSTVSDWMPGNGCNMLTYNQAELAVDTTGWGGYQCTISRDTSTYWTGIASLKWVLTAASGTANTYSIRPSVFGGKPYTFSAYCKRGASNTGNQVYVRIWFYDSSGTYMGVNAAGTARTMSSTDWTRVWVSGTAPANATSCYVETVCDAGAVNDTFWTSGAQLEINPQPTNWRTGNSGFDGSKYNSMDATGAVMTTSGLKVTSTTLNMFSARSFTNGYTLEAKAYRASIPANGWTPAGFITSDTNGASFLDHPTNKYYRNDSTWVSNSGEYPASTWMLFKIDAKNSTTCNLSVTNYTTGATIWNIGDITNAISGERVAFGRRQGESTSYLGQSMDATIQWIRVRKYTANAPAHGAWGAEIGSVSGYKYFKSHTITGSADGAKTDYQIKLTINKGAGSDSAGTVYVPTSHTLNWPYDIKFYNNAGLPLDFWRESYDSSTQTVWVELDSVPASPSTYTLYMYYNKASDTDGSDGDSAFLLFDDFLPSPGVNLLSSTTSSAEGISFTEFPANMQDWSYRMSHTITGSVDDAYATGWWVRWWYDPSHYTTVGDGTLVVDANWSTVNVTDYNPGGYADYYNCQAECTFVVPVGGEAYTFHIGGDDGVALWVDGVQVVTTGWKDQGTTEYDWTSGTWNWGTAHTIVAQHYENSGGERFYVQVSSPSVSQRDLGGDLTRSTHHSSGVNTTNYQMKFWVNQTGTTCSGNTLSLNNLSANFPYDIRFTNASGTVLDHWIETNSGGTAGIWVEIDSIPAAGATVYIYYGNAGAANVSSGANTFLVFDDFSSDTIANYSKYGDSGWTGTWVYDSGNACIKQTDTRSASVFLVHTGSASVLSSTTMGYHWHAKVMVYTDNAGRNHAGLTCDANTNSPFYFYRLTHIDATGYESKFLNGTETGLHQATDNGCYADGAWVSHDVYRKRGGVLSHYSSYSIYMYNWAGSIQTDRNSGGVGWHLYGGQCWVGGPAYLCKWTTNEPWHGSYGAVETAGYAASGFGNSAYTYMMPSAAYAYSGSYSMKLRAKGSGDSYAYISNFNKLDPSTWYTWQAMVYAPTTMYYNPVNGFWPQESGGSYRAPASRTYYVDGSQVSGLATLTTGWHRIVGIGQTYSDWYGTTTLIFRPARNSADTAYDTTNYLYFDCFMVERSSTANPWVIGSSGLDTTKWTNIGSLPITTTASEMTMTGSSGEYRIISAVSFANGALMVRYKQVSGTDWGLVTRITEGSPTTLYLSRVSGLDGANTVTFYKGVTWAGLSSQTLTLPTWTAYHKHTFFFNGSGLWASIDDATPTTTVTDSSYASGKVGIRIYGATTNTADYAAVRSITANELVQGSWGEEVGGLTTWLVGKNVSYAIAQSTSATKSARYAITKTPAATTKSLTYEVKRTPAATTKSLRYTAKRTPAATTKSLTYEVKSTPAAATKSLKYVVRSTHAAVTKSLRYTAKRTPAATTKSLTYEVYSTHAAVTKSMRYTVKTVPAAKTKSDRYATLTTHNEAALPGIFTRGSPAYELDGAAVVAGQPRLEGTGTVVTEGTTNLALNPCFATNLSNWGYWSNLGGGALARTNEWAYYGSYSAKGTRGNDTYLYVQAVNIATVVKGDMVTASAYIYNPNATSKSVTVYLYDREGGTNNGADWTQGGTTVSVPADSAVWISNTSRCAPRSTASVWVDICMTGMNAGEYYYVGALQVEKKLSRTDFTTDTRATVYQCNGITLEEATGNLLADANLQVYNNYGDGRIVTTRTVLSETLYGAPVTRFTFQSTSADATTSMQQDQWSHGCYSAWYSYTGGNTYTQSIYWRCEKADVQVNGVASNISGWSNVQTFQLSNGWKRSTIMWNSATTQADVKHWSFWSPSYVQGQIITIDFAAPQNEQKAYPTSYITANSSRSGELLSVPLDGFNKNSFTVEAIITPRQCGSGKYVMSINSGNSNRFCFKYNSNGTVTWQYYNGTSYSHNSTNAMTFDQPNRVAWRYDATSGEAAMFVNGTKTSQTYSIGAMADFTAFYVGTDYDGASNPADFNIGDLVVSSVSRSDAELTVRNVLTALSPDESTSCYMPLATDLVGGRLYLTYMIKTTPAAQTKSDRYATLTVHNANVLPATFSRSGPAIGSDGSTVAANIPRFETTGVTVEEGTTNLHPNPTLTSGSSNWTAWWSSGTGVFSRSNEWGWDDAWCGKSVLSTGTYLDIQAYTTANSLVSTTYAGSAYIKTSFTGTVTAYLTVQGSPWTTWSSKSFSVTAGVPTRVWCVGATDATGPYPLRFYVGASGRSPGDYILMDAVQIEKELYVTSYANTVRVDEYLTLPTSCLNNNGWTIEFVHTENKPYGSMSGQDNTARFLQVGGYYQNCNFNLWHMGNNVTAYGKADTGSGWDPAIGGVGVLNSTENTATQGVPVRYAVTCSGGNVFNVYVNGALKATMTSALSYTNWAGAKIWLGSDGTYGGSYSMGQYADLMISDAARSTEEMQARGTTSPLTPDEHTSLYAPFASDLNGHKLYMAYVVRTVPAAKTKSLKYTIPKTKAAITKSVTYEVIHNIPGSKSLRYTALTTQNNLLTNWDFNSGTTNWVNYSNTTFEVVTDHVMTPGSKSLHISTGSGGSGTYYSGSFWTTTFPFGTQGTAWAWIYIVSGRVALSMERMSPNPYPVTPAGYTGWYLLKCDFTHNNAGGTLCFYKSGGDAEFYLSTPTITYGDANPKPLTYEVRTVPAAATKSTKYSVLKARSMTKSAKYSVPTTKAAITKSLKYCIPKTKAAITKSVWYEVRRTVAATTKSLAYEVKRTPAATTKSDRYAVRKANTPTKSVRYAARNTYNESILPAAFTRNSPANQINGASVAANQPRFEGIGAILYEATTNLASNPTLRDVNADGTPDGWLLTDITGGSHSLDSTKLWNNMPTWKVDANYTESSFHGLFGPVFTFDRTKAYTVSILIACSGAGTSDYRMPLWIHIRNNSDAVVNDLGFTNDNGGTHDFVWLTKTIAANSTAADATKLALVAPTWREGGTYWIAAVQVEQQDHRTEFVDGSRPNIYQGNCITIEEDTTNYLITQSFGYYAASRNSDFSGFTNVSATNALNLGPQSDAPIPAENVYRMICNPDVGKILDVYIQKGTAMPFGSITNGDKFTISGWYKTSNLPAAVTFSIQKGDWTGAIATGSTTLVADGQWHYLTITITASMDYTTNYHTQFETGYLPNPTNGEVLLNGMQMEKKPYATSFINGTRSAETLTIPTVGMSPSQGTIECVVNVTADMVSSSGKRHFIYWHQTGSPLNWLLLQMGSGSIQFWISNNSGNVTQPSASITSLPLGLHRVAFRWSSQEASAWIDGTKYCYANNPYVPSALDTKVVIGNWAGGEYLDSQIGDFVISTQFRSDAELQARGTITILTPDEYTSMYLPLLNDLSGHWLYMTYRVITVPSAITKGLAYEIKTVPAAKTKSLRYAALKAISATKSLKYTIPKTKAAVTKSVTYEVIHNIPGSKSIRYAVKTTKAAVTKSLSYEVQRTITATIKSLRYAAYSTHAAVTKSLKYTIPKTKAAITKGTVYGVRYAHTAVTKSITYEVRRTVAATTKSLKYTVITTPATTTKSARYAAKTSSNVNVYSAYFNRDSVAYEPDGTQVATDVPRFVRMNMLDNPSFENGSTSWNSVTAVHSAGGMDDGGYAEASYPSGWMYQVKTLMPATSYLVKAWFRVKSTYSNVAMAGGVQIPYTTVTDGEHEARICVLPAGSSESDLPITISSYGCDIAGASTGVQVDGYSGHTANSKGSVMCMLPKDGQWHELWFVVSYARLMNCTINFLPNGGTDTIDVDRCMLIPSTAYVPGFVDDNSCWVMNEEATTNLYPTATKYFTESLSFPIAPPVTPVNGGYWTDLSWSGDIMIPGPYSLGTKISVSGWYMPYTTDTSIPINGNAGMHMWSSNGLCQTLILPTEWNKWYYFEYTYTVAVEGENTIRLEDRGYDYYLPANAGYTKGYWCNVQLEVKPYATTFTSASRSDEDISIPIGKVITSSDWTIEGVFYWPYDATQVTFTGHPTIFQLGDYYSNSSVSLMTWSGYATPPSADHYLQLWVKGQSNIGWSGTAGFVDCDVICNKPMRFAVTCSEGTTFRVFFNGVQQGSDLVIADPVTSWAGTNFYIGERGGVDGPSNGYIGDLMFSNAARTPDELKARGTISPLAPDEHTAMYLPLSSDLVGHRLYSTYRIWTTHEPVPKATKYRVRTVPAAQTMDAKYAVYSTHPVTKDLRYAVKTVPAAKTKSVTYEVRRTVAAATKALTYEIKTVPAAQTKSMVYRVRTVPTAATKSLRYAVRTVPAAQTKSDRYAIKTSPATTKSLKYCIPKTKAAITKSAAYEVIHNIPGSKSLRYAVRTVPAAATKSTRYGVLKVISTTKSLKYVVYSTHAAVTKSVKYTVPTVHSTSKSLKYTIPKTKAAVTKSMTYEVQRTITATTKSLRYTAKTTPAATTKSLRYVVYSTHAAVTKSLKYVVYSTHAAVTKSVKYTVPRTMPAATKSLKYTVPKTKAAITESVRYTVRTAPAAKTKSDRYAVLRALSSTKSDRYATLSAHNVNTVQNQFDRPSPAYKLDGSTQVAAGVPRLESMGVTIEEATANLIPSIQVSLVNGTVATDAIEAAGDYAGWHKTTVTHVGNGWDAHLIRVAAYLERPFPTTYTYSVEFYAPNSDIKATIDGTGYTCATLSNVSGYKHWVVSTYNGPNDNDDMIHFCYLNGNNKDISTYFYWRNPQIESHPYPTSYIDVGTDRDADILKVPTANVLSPTEATIECVVNVNANIKATGEHDVFSHTNGDTGNQTNKISLDHTGSNWRFILRDANAYPMVLSAADNLSLGQHRFAVRWKANEAALFIDGNKVATTDTPYAPSAVDDYMYIGQWARSDFIAAANTQIGDFMISSVWRDDVSLQARGTTAPLAPDEHTALYMPLTASLNGTTLYSTYSVYSTHAAVTKSTAYRTNVTKPAVTKTLRYTAKTVPAAQTKSVTYEVRSVHAAITKSLRYAAKATPTAPTKSVTYEVRSAHAAITKSLRYTAKTVPAATTKSLRYTAKTVPAATTKSMRYTVLRSIAPTKSVKYTIPTTHNVAAPDPMFVRATTAYMPDGTLVASGAPRLDVSGLLLEEKANNLINANINLYNNMPDDVVTTRTVLGETYNGFQIVRMTYQPTTAYGVTQMQGYIGKGCNVGGGYNYTVGTHYLASIYWRSDKSIYVYGTPANNGGWADYTAIDAGDGWTRSVADRYKTDVTQSDGKWWGFNYPACTLNEVVTIDWACPMMEDRPNNLFAPCPTTYMPNNTTRDAEILRIPAGVFDKDSWTLECVINPKACGDHKYIFSIDSGNTNRWNLKYLNDGTLIWEYYDGSSMYYFTSSNKMTIGADNRVAWRYDRAAGKGALFINGTKTETDQTLPAQADFTHICVGAPYSESVNVDHGNFHVRDLMFSRSARADSEMSARSPATALVPDAYTTYYAPLVDDIVGHSLYTTYMVITAPKATKSLKYCVPTVPAAKTKSLRYAVLKPITVAKSLKYTVPRAKAAITKSTAYEVVHNIPGSKSTRYAIKVARSTTTKSTRYGVLKAISTTKSLRYVVYSTHATVTRSLKYTVPITKPAVTKALKYTVPTHTAVTKSLRYAVRTVPAAQTKSLRYAARKANTITESTAYRTKTTKSITKSAVYDIVTVPAAQTKSMVYRVRTVPAAKTKSLQYVVRSLHPANKVLTYEVRTSPKATKALKYTIPRTPTAQTKALKYTIPTTKAAVTKSLRYTVRTVPATTTKSLTYRARTVPAAMTKSLRYAVRTAPKPLKSTTYDVRTSPKATKSLRHAVRTSTAQTKELKYVVYSTHPATKSLKYTVPTTHASTKSVSYVVTFNIPGSKSTRYAIKVARSTTTKSTRYGVLKVISTTKSIRYVVYSTHAAVTKALKYCIPITKPAITKALTYRVRTVPAAQTKGIRYAARTVPAAQTKDLRYAARRSIGMTESTRYGIRTVVPATKPLIYMVRTAPAQTKSLRYAVRTVPAARTKSIKYSVKASPAIVEALKYAIPRTMPAITKSAEYEVIKLLSGAKSLRYAVRTTKAAITKSMRYAVLKTIPATKATKYVVYSTHTSTKSLKYTVPITKPAVTKAAAYEVIKPLSGAKFLRYTVRTVPAAQTKSLRYTVRTVPAASAKQLKYVVYSTHPATKSLKYCIPITKPAVTKALKYTVPTVHPATKSLKYTVPKTKAAITKSIRYAVRTVPAARAMSATYCVETVPAIHAKGIKYVVRSTPNVAKALKYTVPTTKAATKGIAYEVTHNISGSKSARYATKTVPAAKTKSMAYRVRTIPAAASKGLRYVVYSTHAAVTKALKYTVPTVHPATKSLKYTVPATPDAIRRTLKYVVPSGKTAINIDMAYAVQATKAAINKYMTHRIRTVPPAGTKAIKYVVRSTHASSKVVKYAVPTVVTKTENLKYTIPSTKAAVIKALTYAVRTVPAAQTKGIRYAVKTTKAAVTKGARYGVLRASVSEKGVKYTVPSTKSLVAILRYVVPAGAGFISKSLQYVVRSTHAAVTKPIRYAVKVTPDAKAKSTQYVVRSLHPAAKSLKYTVPATKPVVTKSTAYEVTHNIPGSKSLRYAVKATKSATTKSVAYGIVNTHAITKTLKYTVPSTKAAIPKALKYTIPKTLAAITKSLAYGVRTIRAATKSVRYALTITNKTMKTVRYSVAPKSAILVPMRYAVEYAQRELKSLVYCVSTTTPATKQLRYVVESAQKATKALKYTVPATKPVVTKSTAYEVTHNIPGSKSTRYAIHTAAAARSMAAAYGVLKSGKATKSLKYVVRSTHAAVTETLRYAVPNTKPAVTKTMGYVVAGQRSAIQKPMRYAVEATKAAMTKSARYAVAVPTPAGKALKYAVRTSGTTAKDAKYVVYSTHAVAKAAKYTVPNTKPAVTKVLRYTVKTTASAMAKQMRYAVRRPASATKALKYTVPSTKSAITKVTVYEVTHNIPGSKSTRYAVRIAKPTMTKSLGYKVLSIPAARAKALRYAVYSTGATVAKLIRYAARVVRPAIESEAEYSVLKAVASTKSLKYTVPSTKVVTKGMRYTVATPASTTRTLDYSVRSIKSTAKNTRYCVMHIISAANETPMRYTVPATKPAVTKSVTYTVSRPKSMGKELKYTLTTEAKPRVSLPMQYCVVAPAPAVTKAMKYIIGSPMPAITKGVTYVVVKPVITDVLKLRSVVDDGIVIYSVVE